jgi:hypothetical protein
MRKLAIVGLMIVVASIVIAGETPSRAQSVCRLNEARQIACAAATKSYDIDRSWPRAEGIFENNMRYLGCAETTKWNGVCK